MIRIISGRNILIVCLPENLNYTLRSMKLCILMKHNYSPQRSQYHRGKI